MSPRIDDLPRIDRYTCKFENPVMEDQYMASQWMKVKKGLSFALVFLTLVLIFDTFTSFERFGGFKPILLGFPILIGLLLSFFILPESFKEKRHGLFLAVSFSIIHTFQIIQAFAIDNAPEMDSLELLTTIPTIFMFLGILFPFNLITTISIMLFLLVTSIPAMDFTGISSSIIMFNLPIPIILILWNKYNNEYNNRLNFAKTVSIDDTKNLMQKTLRRYFGDVLSNKMLNDEGGLSGDNKWVSLSFTDLTGYSTIIEHMSPKVAVEFLNEYFTEMHNVIEEFNGHILNYIGDSIMVVFGAPEELSNHENLSVKCAVKMREKLVELNQRWDENELSRYWRNHGIDSITARTGIHTGSIIAGNIGSERMLQYSAIGDVVNVAARLEQANKEYDSDIAFSQEIYTALTKKLNESASFEGEIQLKGRTGATKVYSI